MFNSYMKLCKSVHKKKIYTFTYKPAIRILGVTMQEMNTLCN